MPLPVGRVVVLECDAEVVLAVEPDVDELVPFELDTSPVVASSSVVVFSSHAVAARATTKKSAVSPIEWNLTIIFLDVLGLNHKSKDARNQPFEQLARRSSSGLVSALFMRTSVPGSGHRIESCDPALKFFRAVSLTPVG